MQINRSSSIEEFCSSNGAQCFDDAIVISCGKKWSFHKSSLSSFAAKNAKSQNTWATLDSFTSLRHGKVRVAVFIDVHSLCNQYTGASADLFGFLGIVLHPVLLLPFSSDAVAASAKLKNPRIRFPHGPILPGSPLHGSTHLQMGHTKFGGTSGYLTLAPAKKKIVIWKGNEGCWFKLNDIHYRMYTFCCT